MNSHCDADKWNRVYASDDHGSLRAARVIRDNAHLLPESGKALDLACGLGANARLLAQHGLETYAWDISQTALDKLEAGARQQGIPLHLEMRDITINPPLANSFDVIVVSRFLQRTLIPRLIAALRKDGLIYYQTFIKEKTENAGPRNADFRLDSNELLHFFHDLQILHYREEGRIGDLTQGFRNEAMLIARKTGSTV